MLLVRISHLLIIFIFSYINFYLEPNNPEKVLVRKLVLVSEGQPEKVLDLTGDISKLKKKVFCIKEGVQYKIRIEFFVQHEIVTGLKYVQKTYRKGIQGIMNNMSCFSYADLLHGEWLCIYFVFFMFAVDKMTHMVGR